MTPVETTVIQLNYMFHVIFSLEKSLNTWLSAVNISLADTSIVSLSLKAKAAEPLSRSSQLQHALVAFEGTFTTSVLEYLVGINDVQFEINIDPLTNVILSAKLSHWHSSVESPYDTRTNYSYSPMAVQAEFERSYPSASKTIETLTIFNGCPYVVLPLSEVSLNMTNNGVYLEDYNTELSYDFILIDSSSAYLCLDTFQNLAGQFYQNNTHSEAKKDDGTESLVSFVCVLISVLFSFLTFFVYCLFKELRTQPGINNMILSLHLAVSQLFFQFGYASSNDVSGLTCTILGVVVHYSWLLLLMWMNVCTIHMFIVFYHSQTVAKENNRFMRTLKYILYCSVIALVPVVTNIVLAWVKSNGNDIGYGGEFCYLRRNVWDIYLLAVPVGLIISTNIVLYVIAIVQIHRTKSNHSNRSENQNLAFAYAKLSTITGSTWVFGFVYLLGGYAWAEYAFIALNATQGLFIFVAFIANKRTFDLARKRFLKRRNDKLHSSVSSGTHTDFSNVS